jgi:glutathione S-transferase
VEQKEMLAQLRERLVPFEEMLISRPFLLDDRPRFVDFDLYGMLANFLYSGHYRLPAAHTRLRKWYDRMTHVKRKSPPREKELHS